MSDGVQDQTIETAATAPAPPVPIGRQRQPRTLVMTADDAFAAAIAEMVPTCMRVRHYSQVEQSEWDVLVTTEKFTTIRGAYVEQPASHLFVISLGEGHLGSIAGEGGPQRRIQFIQGSRSREYVVPDELATEFRRLVREDLLPAVAKRSGDHHSITDFEGAMLFPLLLTAQKDVLAALGVRGDDGGLLLALPNDVSNRAGWVKAGLQLFRRFDADRFREIPGWEEQSAWQTSAERRIQEALDDLEADRAAAHAEFAAREYRLRGELADAAAAADRGARRLLTAQDTELETAVFDGLGRLGFEVTRMDPLAEPGNKLEDLRVRDPEDGEWEALVEVKGKTRGASWGDISAMSRFIKNYRDSTGRWPAAVWYVVNQFAGQDPARRVPVLISQDQDLDRWADDSGGLAIDTAELFQLLTAVEAGDLVPEVARQQLRRGRKRYVYAASSGADDDVLECDAKAS